jgi:hypothetical protein
MDENEMDLRAELERLSDELSAARSELEELRLADPPRGPNRKVVAALTVALVVLGSWSLYAQTPSRISTTPEGVMLDLVRRVTALENGRHRVTAPFEVVDKGGTAIFQVTEDPVRGFAVVAPNGVPRGGFATEGPDAYMLVANALGQEARIGSGSRGNMILRFGDGEGTNIAGLGIGALSPHGTLVLSDASGVSRVMAQVDGGGDGRVDVFGTGSSQALVALKIDGGHGTVAVYNQSGFPVATMVERNAGGVLTAHGPNGDGVFVANWEPPTGQGEACVNRRNGKWCLGINLPLGIGAGTGR